MVLNLIVDLVKNKVLAAIVLIIILFLISKVLAFIIKNIVHGITNKTKTKLDDLILGKTQKWVVALLFFIGLRAFVLPILVSDMLNKINNAIIILIITFIVAIISDVLIDFWGKAWAKKTKSTIDDALVPLFHKFSRIIIFVIGFIVILGEFDINVGPFLASLGIAGIVLGLALQDTLSNIFGGISIILDKSFQVGDTIKLSSGEFGTIKDIGLRSTKLKTFENELLLIPNKQMANSVIQNFAKPELSVRVNVPFSVAYGSKIDKVEKVILGSIKKIKNALKDPAPEVLFLEMADFSLNFEARFWVGDYRERFKAKIKANKLIYEDLNKAKIDIPFPTRTVYVKKKR